MIETWLDEIKKHFKEEIYSINQVQKGKINVLAYGPKYPETKDEEFKNYHIIITSESKLRMEKSPIFKIPNLSYLILDEA